jgi:hypothetical protein
MAQGGVPSSATFNKGILTSGSVTFNNLPIPVNSTVRIKLRRTAIGGSDLIFITNGIGGTNAAKFILQFQSTNAIRAYAGIYIYDSTITPLTSTTKQYDIVFTNHATIGGQFYLDGAVNASLGANRTLPSRTPITLYATTAQCEIESFEVYNYYMTAVDVANLYNNSRYRDVNLSKDEQLGPELVVNGGFDTGNNWIPEAGWSISNGKLVGNATSTDCPQTPNILVSGKRYKITVNVSSYSSGSFTIKSSASASTTSINAVGIHERYLQADNIVFEFDGTSFTGEIDSISCKEVLVERTRPILDVCCGVNKLSGNVYGSNLVLNNNFSSGWTLNAATATINTIITSSTGGAYKALCTVGKRYRIEVVGSLLNAGTFRINNSEAGATNTLYETTGTSISYTGEFTAADTEVYFRHTVATTIIITTFNLYEIIPSVTNTSVSLVKDGDRNVMSFNGSASKLDCGSYDGLVGDKTFIAWVNPINVSTITNQLFGNGKLAIATVQSGSVYVYSDGATVKQGVAGSIKAKKWNFIVVTRTSTGITNIYVDSVLSGAANGSSGTPAAGTESLKIGYNPLAGAYYKGTVDKVRIIDGILTTNEISQIYSNEKQYYNL